MSIGRNSVSSSPWSTSLRASANDRAILLFNKNKNFSQVLEQVEPTLRAHSRFVCFEGKKNETEYQFTVSHPDDAARHITLTVLAFDIPHDN